MDRSTRMQQNGSRLTDSFALSESPESEEKVNHIHNQEAVNAYMGQEPPRPYHQYSDPMG
jgi:hypothetical protein